MDFAKALEKIEDASSVGGQLIVVRDGKHILVGKQVQGVLIVEDTDEARAVAAEAGIKVEVEDDDGEPKTHEVRVDDTVKTADRASGRK